MFLVTLISFVFFTALVGFATWLVVHKKESSTQEGFFLAGRSLRFPFIAGSLLLTNLSTEQLVGLNGSAFAEGFMIFTWEVVASISLVLLACIFLPRYLKYNITTLPEYLGKRIGKSTSVICNVIFLISYVFLLLPIILYTGATGLNGILNMHELTGIQNDMVLLWGTIIFIGVLGAIYALFGGLRTVAVSDLFNGIGLLIGGFMITYFGLLKAGDGQGVWAGLQAVREFAPEKFHSLGGPESSIPFSTLFTGVLLINVYYWCTNQQIIQRALGAKSLAEGQKGVFLCGFLKLLGPIYLVLPGIIAFYLVKKANIEIKPDEAYGVLVHHVLPAPLKGFFAAVVVGAILSSFNSVLNSTCTLFSLGPYKSFFNKTATDEQVVASGKVFGWIVAILSMMVAPLLARTTSIFSYLQLMNSVFATPLLAVIVIAILRKHVPAWAANASLISGCILTLLFILFPINLNSFHISGIIFWLLMLGMLLAEKFFPAPEKQIAQGPLVMNTWKWSLPVSIIIVLTVIAFYIVML